MDAADLTARWATAWGDCRPIGHELRSCLHDRWVRFHSLPGSKRYAGSKKEYAEMLGRHLTVLAELLARDGTGAERELLVVTASWSGGPAPAPREAELAGVLPAAEHWMSILTEDSVPGEETWTHLWVSAVRFPAEDLSRLLRLAADYVTAGVIITTADMSWLYHPPPHERRADRALNCLVPRVHSMSVRTVRSQRFQAQVALLCRQQDSALMTARYPPLCAATEFC